MTLIKKASEDKVLYLRSEKTRLEGEIEMSLARIEDLQRGVSEKKVALRQIVGELELLAKGEEQGMLF